MREIKKKVAIFLAGILSIFAINACDNNEHAGVMTETESGKTLAGNIVNALGNGAAKVTVSLIDTNFISTRSEVKYSTTTDENGNYRIDSIVGGTYTILVEDASEESLATRRIFIPSDTAENDIIEDSIVNAGTDTLFEASQVAVKLDGFSTALNDTICIPGTFSCRIITAEDISNKIAVLRSIPKSVYSRLAKMTQALAATDSLETIGIHWNLSPGGTYIAAEPEKYAGADYKVTRTLPDTLQKSIATEVDSIPFPIWLPSEAKYPLLIDNEGNVLPIEKAFDSGDSILYWALVPKIDFTPSTSMTFSIFDSSDVYVTMGESPLRYKLHWDSLAIKGIWNGGRSFAAGTSPDTISNFSVFSNENTALSFWVKMDSTAFGKDSSVALLSAMKDSLGFVIRQNKNNKYRSIGVELFVNSDTTVISDTTIYGPRYILDGNWHNYSLIIRKDHIYVLLDGKVIHNTDFQLAGGFGNVENIILGDTSLTATFDELLIFNGTQDTTAMRTLYEISRPDQVGWTFEK